MDSQEIEQLIRETERELSALKKLLEVAKDNTGKPKARGRGPKPGQMTEGQQKIVREISHVLVDGPITFLELMQKTKLKRGALLNPLGNGPFRKTKDNRWELIPENIRNDE